MINVLPQTVVNQIAAGEVVERPASVLKELMENSIDAGSTEIKVYIREYGTEKIQVIDNGSGIEQSDLDKVFLKHATSKIAKSEDLDAIETFGFRGEALASISSVSRVLLQTKHADDEVGTEVAFENGSIQSLRPSSLTKGTDLQILDLFSNVPARKKFLKAKSTESKALLDIFNKFVLANPEIAFYIDIDGTSKTYPVEDIQSRAAKILKVDREQLVPIYYDGQIKVGGYVIHPKVFLKNRGAQYLFVNKRPVIDTTVYKAIVDGYDTFLMKHQIAGYVVFVDLQPNQVDVNVHPRKTEVRFANPSDVYRAVRTGVNVNLVKFLREETQRKLNMRPEQQSVGAFVQPSSEVENTNLKSSIVAEPTSPAFTAEEHNQKLSPAREFADFLLADAKKTPLEPSIIAEAPENTSSLPYGKINNQKPSTSQALLFSQEVIKEDHESPHIYLDFANSTQLLDSYIITSNGKDLLIIDQHAASERFFYEKYLKQISSKRVESKLLLFPEVVQLDTFERKTIEENKAVFVELGFDFEPFGADELKFTKVPDFVKMDNFQKIIEKIINDVLEHGEISNIKEKLHHEIAAILACHTAVRFGDKLTREEVVRILRNLSTCEDPYNCPHGRPVIQEFSKYDIEKKFKRCGL
jgi:DNA mismatch repair protein MutL